MFALPVCAVFAAQAPFVDAAGAMATLHAGATVLDTRSRWEFMVGHLPGALRIDLEDFRTSGPTGRLLDDDRILAGRLSRLGIRADRAVLVYGHAGLGWGQEGRVAWMLAYLGHPQVQILDGGWKSWQAAGGAIERGLGRSPTAGQFVAHRQAALRADIESVRLALSRADPVVVDVRTRAEWDGERRFGERRGGHLPGARLFDWKRLFAEGGRLRPAAELRQMLAWAGIDPAREIIVYCTGGVRSSYVWAALRSLGFARVRNFDGSFLEWAAAPGLPVQ